MKTYEFRCRLLSDLVLTSSAATESHSSSLNYIPGSKFLGIVSRSLYQMNDEKSTIDIFHNGIVRFGDAHPMVKEKRLYPSPANFYYKKGEGLSDSIFLHHNLNKSVQEKLRSENVQLKQSRTGYIQPELKRQLTIKQNYRLKSAYDNNTRKSKDSQMFGYFSLAGETEWVFLVEDNSGFYLDKIKKALEGKKRIGRSKSAEYGLVEISFLKEIDKTKETILSGRTIIYAQSNLCFVNQYGETTAQPSPQQLAGEVDCDILWKQSQVRSRKYQSWNGKRNCKDSDRVIIEKGSVFVLHLNKPISSSFYDAGIGSYKSEGFGSVLINPDFLPLEGPNLGYSFSKQSESGIKKESYSELPDESAEEVFKALEKRQNLVSFDQDVKSEVKEFLENHRNYFKSVSKSQWGTLRAYAKQCLTLDAFNKLVFGKTNEEGLEGFIYKGSSQTQWKVGGKFLQDEIQRIAKKEGEKFAFAFVQKLTVEISKSR